MGAPRPQTAVNVNSRTIRAMAQLVDCEALKPRNRNRKSFSALIFLRARKLDRARDQAQR